MSKPRRFGAHEVSDGPFAGELHVASQRYKSFFSELNYLGDYLNRRLLPCEPEEAQMQSVLTNLQNLLEYESEMLIAHYAAKQGTAKEQQFQSKIANGYVSFKTKCDWSLARSLISQNDWDVMDQVRELRNQFVHTHPTNVRRRFKYRGLPLLSQSNIRRMFVDVELVLRQLRSKCGRSCDWATVPPGYASDLQWPDAHIRALNTD